MREVLRGNPCAHRIRNEPVAQGRQDALSAVNSGFAIKFGFWREHVDGQLNERRAGLAIEGFNVVVVDF